MSMPLRESIIQSPITNGGLLMVFIALCLVLSTKISGKSGLYSYMIESIYDFFDTALGEGRENLKSFCTNLFFLILIANIAGTFFDMFNLAFPGIEKFIVIPTGDIHLPLVMAAISIAYMLYVQAKTKGLGSMLYDYLPIGGKNMMGAEEQTIGGKIADIALSLFVGILDIVGVFAKIISLSARLFGNIFSGGILAWVVIGGLSMISTKLLGFDLPILLPVIIIAQSLLVACIQAFVFPLLVGIFIKIGVE